MTSPDTNPKRPRSQRTNLFLLGIILLVVPLVVAGLLVWLVGTPDMFNTTPADLPLIRTPTGAAEHLTVPFGASEATLSEGSYNDTVRLVIEGSGPSADGGLSDAFYRFEAADGTPLDPPVSDPVLSIGGQTATTALELNAPPPYSRFHLYEVAYTVGPEARPLAFQVAGESTPDEPGELSIFVVPNFQPGGDGS